MTVFSFKIIYDRNDAPQTRYVVASSSADAWTKLVVFVDQQRKEGFMFPQIIFEPEVEIDEVIL